MTALTARLGRVRIGLGLAAQAAIAAGLAWFVAHDLLGHVQPFFAPIAAVVVLAISVGQRLRRAFEIIAGNAVGILLGEVLIFAIGRGAWQVSLVVLLAIVIAMLFGGSASLVMQAASSASLVATLVPPEANFFLSRFIDAVVGGLAGVGVMALLLPLNPLTVVGREARTLLGEIASGLSGAATSLTDHDIELAESALDRMRRTEPNLRAYHDAVNAGREISLVAPLRWRKRDVLGQYVASYTHVARLLRNCRVLTARTLSLMRDGEPVPEALPTAIRSLAEAVTWLRDELAQGVEPVACQGVALRAVRQSAHAYGAGVGFSGGVVVAQIRSAASDLVRAGGTPPQETHRLVREAVEKG
ncbi:FUSC family protein [Allorhizocola rhizosphaerae]|uniref:FUSC family protein n=1 Tax=Allorhizocola rhizosphaerae TaxID=1872709 RepID=UPI001FEB733D|nr:FUSC family protein [Allorhizocola rhizosphaerae]